MSNITPERLVEAKTNEADANQVLTGIMFKVASVAFLVSMSALIKLIGDGVPVGQVIFFRAFFAILPVLLYLAYRGELEDAYKTSRPLRHIARSFIGCCGMGLGFYGLTKLPLHDVVALRHATPLFAVMFAAFLLGEKVRVYRWAAVAAGLSGVLIISWPSITLFEQSVNRGILFGVIATIVSTMFAALASILIRTLVTTEKSPTIVIYFSTMASLFAAMTAVLGWVSLDVYNAAIMVSAGIVGGVGQILMTECYRHAPVSTVAPFDYTSIVFGIVLGFLLFGDLPSAHMLWGTAIVAGAGIFIIYREHQLGLESAAQKRVTRLRTH